MDKNTYDLVAILHALLTSTTLENLKGTSLSDEALKQNSEALKLADMFLTKYEIDNGIHKDDYTLTTNKVSKGN